MHSHNTTSNIQNNKDSNEHITDFLPWDLIASFLQLDDVCQMRLTSTVILETLHTQSSPRMCASWIAQVLQARNAFMCLRQEIHEGWRDATQGSTISIQEALRLASHDNESSPLDIMIRILRVLKYLPKQAVIKYDTVYGRHLIPYKPQITLEKSQTFDPESAFSHHSVYPFPKCERNRCVTCREKAWSKPISNQSTGDPQHIDDALVIYQGSRRLLDMEHYSTQCIPNLPSDIACPICRVQDRRTLVLREFSYVAEQGSRAKHLSFTPRWNNQEDDQDDDSNSSDREIRKHDSMGGTFPPKYPGYEGFMPDPIEDSIPEDCKFCISIHCEMCRKFLLLSPGRPCQGRAGCRVRVNTDTTHIGGVIVRQACSQNGCIEATPCTHCQQMSVDRDGVYVCTCRRPGFCYCNRHQEELCTCRVKRVRRQAPNPIETEQDGVSYLESDYSDEEEFV